MATTPILGLRYPASTDPPQGNAQIQNLAEDVDNAAVILQAKKSIIAAEQTTTSSTYAYLGTPDRVQGLSVQVGNLVTIAFTADLRVNGTPDGATAAQIQATSGDGAVLVGISDAATPLGDDNSLYSTPGGLLTPTGRIGLCIGYVTAAGTLEVGVKFKKGGATNAGALNRKLWVKVEAYD